MFIAMNRFKAHRFERKAVLNAVHQNMEQAAR